MKRKFHKIALRGCLKTILLPIRLFVFQLRYSYLLSRNILGLAFHEIIAILGLILGFLSQNVLSFVPFAVVALSLNMLAFPRTEQMLQQLQMQQG